MPWRTSWSSLVVALAACASGPDWVRDGTSREAMEADLLACDVVARAVPTVPRPRDRLGVAHPDMPDADHQLDLAQRVDRCMRGRGYTFQRTRRLLM